MVHKWKEKCSAVLRHCVDQHMSRGKQTVVFNGSDYGSGIYLYKFESKGFIKTGKMLLLK